MTMGFSRIMLLNKRYTDENLIVCGNLIVCVEKMYVKNLIFNKSRFYRLIEYISIK